MSNHQKRLSVPETWPVERKTETFTVKADAGPHGEAGVPLLVLLRDVLGYVDSRKEARYALNQDNVVINGTPINDEERPVGMFDILVFAEREEYYRVFPGEGGRLALTPIDADAAASKLGKIVGKRQVEGGDTQLTLHDGHTLVVDDGSAYAGSDSIVIANADDEVVAHFPFEEGALVTAVDGTHAGEIGTVETVQVTPGSAPNNISVAQDDGDGFETIEEYIVVIDENFTGDDGDDAPAEPAGPDAEPVAEDETADADEDDADDADETDDVDEDETDDVDEDDADDAETAANADETDDVDETDDAAVADDADEASDGGGAE